MSDDYFIMRPQRIRGGRKPPFKKVSVSAAKKQLLQGLYKQHPEWVVREYIAHAKTIGVTLTPDEVWSAIYPG